MSNNPQDECRYFLTYSGVKLPFKLAQQLEPASIENRNTFFQAWFDAEERVTAFQKIVYGEVDLEHRYHYHDNGQLAIAEIVDAEGDVREMHFDENGAPRRY